MLERQIYEMSPTLKRLVHDTLVARFHIHPAPATLSQSMALYSYFASLTNYPLIQYRHAREAKAGSWARTLGILFRDPLPKADSQNTHFLLDNASNNADFLSFNGSLDGRKSQLPSLDKSEVEGDDHADRITTWRKNTLSVRQVSLPKRLHNFIPKLLQKHSQGSVSTEDMRRLWDQTEYYYPVSRGMASSIQAAFSSSTEPSYSENGFFNKTVHLTASPESPETVVVPLEHRLLNTVCLILDNSTNTFIPFEDFLNENLNANIDLLKDFESGRISLSDVYSRDTRYTYFELTLAVMSREPDIVTYGVDSTLLDKLKIPKFTTVSNSPDLKKRIKAFDRFRLERLKGFTGSLDVKE